MNAIMLTAYCCFAIWTILTVRVYTNALYLILYRMPSTPAVDKFKRSYEKHPISTKVKLFIVCFFCLPILRHLAR